MIKDGELPVLKQLLDDGTWSRVTSHTDSSSGSVWPDFAGARPACEHGLYTLWNWDPQGMTLAYATERQVAPFWKAIDEQGTTVGVLDMAFTPFLGLPKGFEVHEWGAHSRVEGRVRVSPPAVAEAVRRFPNHPFTDDLARPPAEPGEQAAFLEECIAGARLRGDLAEHLITRVRPDISLVSFEEAHHAGHFLWHTVEPDLEMYSDLPPEAWPQLTLVDLYRELDRQVGRLVGAAGPGTAVFVFALHGMEPSRGLPPVLEPLLDRLGMACLAPADRRRSASAALKSRIPAPIRNAYRRSVPLARRSQWGKSAVLPSYDWSRTRAFALPMEQFGNIRINLAGREAQGIVPPEQYDETCDVIEQAARALTTVDGRPVVADVVRPPRGSHPAGLPDLVVHWDRAAFESPAVVDGVEIPNVRRLQTGHHASDGFCIASGPAAASTPEEAIAGEDLHRVLVGALRR
jgi:predicted AlkP superfamily phosphohydrolase/phosphomutase